MYTSLPGYISALPTRFWSRGARHGSDTTPEIGRRFRPYAMSEAWDLCWAMLTEAEAAQNAWLGSGCLSNRLGMTETD
jgi:hypothetical protein